MFIFIVFDYSNIEYQFVQEVHEFNGLNIYLGIDGISIYFVLLTTILTPIVLVIKLKFYIWKHKILYNNNIIIRNIIISCIS